jgi:hypothetical protein
MIGLNPGQVAYNLPPNAIDIKTAALRTSNRNLGGTPFSSNGGIAANAFDNDPSTACTQNAPNGYISYNWGLAQFNISMVGIMSYQTLSYSIVCEYSFDNVTWINSLTIPEQDYPQRQTQWFSIPVPIYSNYFRIRETEGGTLNISELYFNTNVTDTLVTRVSESEYTSYPNKNQLGRPSLFWVDRQISPVVYIWPAPNYNYNNLYFTYWKSIQDAGGLINVSEVPTSFMAPLCYALAYQLSIKEGVLDRMQALKLDAESSYSEAGIEDSERVPLRLIGDYTQ